VVFAVEQEYLYQEPLPCGALLYRKELLGVTNSEKGYIYKPSELSFLREKVFIELMFFHISYKNTISPKTGRERN
jgi:hypothetical protein